MLGVSFKLLLASASPRRRAIMTALGFSFEVVALDLSEEAEAGEEPQATAERLARAKAVAAARPGRVTVGADTVVELGGRALGKPRSEAEAASMLRALRGTEHRVITAVAVAMLAPAPILRDSTQALVAHNSSSASSGVESGLADLSSVAQVWSESSVARVWMRAYTDAEIARYISSGDPFDKAGAYAIQNEELHPVERVEGCRLTVVGLPPPELFRLLAAVGMTLPTVNGGDLRRLCQGCIDEDRLLTGGG